MVNASNAVAAEKAGGKAAAERVSGTAAEKAAPKIVEKRRALGRGLESLLPALRQTAVASGQGPVASEQRSNEVGPVPAVVEEMRAAEETPAVGLPSAATARSGMEEKVESATAAAKAEFENAALTAALKRRATQNQPGSKESSYVPAGAKAEFANAALEDAALGAAQGGATSNQRFSASSAVVEEIRASGETAAGELFYQVPLELIDDNPHQFRLRFDEDGLAELADSIRAQGVLQPVVVRPGKEGRWTLVVGERRLRAARLAELETIPAIVKRVGDQQAAEMTIVENLQRQDLNCVDQAAAFANLSTQFKLTQQQIGERVGCSRQVVTNYMRLLTLSEGIIGALQKGELTYSHARILLMVEDTERRWTLAKKAIEEKMAVAKLESLVTGTGAPEKSGDGKPEGAARWVDPNVRAAQRSLEEILGMRVRIRDRAGRGRILIEYNTIDDFERVVRMLKGSE